MANHPNRGWRSRWTVDLDKCEARHRDGWVFVFKQADGEPVGVLDGICQKLPDPPLNVDDMRGMARIAREAGEIYVEERAKRH